MHGSKIAEMFHSSIRTGELPQHEDARSQPAILNPAAAYDAFAPYYKTYSETKKLYLEKIEELVVARAGKAGSLLDVGAGDGARGMRIAQRVGADRVVLLEPSAGMRAQCTVNVEVWPYTAVEIPEHAPSFDLILCLWNVLGHVQGAPERLRTLSRLKKLMAPGGRIFLDVNHRYNVAAYGWSKTLARMIHDMFIRSSENGDVMVSWQVGEQMVRTTGHVFTAAEMKKLIRAAGLKVAERWTIHCESGKQCSLPIFGHLLYQLTAA